MTNAEMEMELDRLRDQLSQLQQQADARTKRCRSLACAGFFLVLLYAVMGVGGLLASHFIGLPPRAQDFLEALSYMYIIAQMPMVVATWALSEGRGLKFTKPGHAGG